MTNTSALRDEVIVTGFEDTQTAFLAQAALARLQREMRMAIQMAVKPAKLE